MNKRPNARAQLPVFLWEAWCSVKVKEADSQLLEFALNAEEDRRGKSVGWLSDVLWDVMRKQLEEGGSKAQVAEKSIYGSVSFRVSAETHEELIHALSCCTTAVRKWEDMFHIKRLMTAYLKTSTEIKHHANL